MTDHSDQKQKTALGAILIVVLSLTIGWLIHTNSDEKRLPNDVAQAIIAARHLAAGEGYFTDSLYYPENYAPEMIPAPQTVFPPGHSILIALARPLTNDPMRAAFWVSLTSLVLTPISLYVLCLQCNFRPSVAVMACLLWLGLITAWQNALLGKSDIVFLVLTLFSAIAVVRPVKKPIQMAFIAGCLAAMAFLVRYAGLFFMLSAALAIVWDWYRQRSRVTFKELVAFCIPTGITVGIMFGRNYLYTTDMRGGNSYRSAKTTIESVQELYYALVELVGLSHRVSAWNPAEFIFLIAVVAAAGLGWKHRRNIRWNQQQVNSALNSRGLTLGVIYTVITFGLLIYMELTTCVGLRARMFMAVVPFCLMFAAWIPELVSIESKTNSGFRIVGLLLSIAFLLGQVKSAPRVFSARPNYQALATACEYPVNGGPTLKTMLLEEISSEHPVLANEPQVLGAIIERPIVGLADSQYTAYRWTSDEVLSRVRKFDVQWVVHFNGDNIEASETMPFYTALVDGQVPEWLTVVDSNQYFTLFRVEPESALSR